MKKYLLILPCLLVLGATTPTYAEDKGAQYKPFYFHISGGQTEDEDDSDFKAKSYGLAFGWQPSPYASLEIAYNYHDYDKFYGTHIASGDSASVQLAGSTLEVAVVATPIIYPIRPIGLFGIIHDRTKVDSATRAGRPATAARLGLPNSASATEPLFGAGIDFDFTESFGGRLIYKTAGGDINSKGLFLGATFRF